MPNMIAWTVDTRELDRITANCDMNTEQILRRLAFEIMGDAKQLAPRDTSALSNSIYVDTGKENGYEQAAQAAHSARPGVETEPALNTEKGQVVVAAAVEYAGFVEFGTPARPNYPKQPYFIPAFERVRGKFDNGETYQELIR